MNSMVSVIVPIYNVEKYLDRCIESVINQTYDNLQIILVDDGSIDNSSLMCDEYAKKDNRIKVIHKENGGLTSARKAGFNKADGEYIVFIDSDDYIERNYIAELYNSIVYNKSDIAICSYFLDNKDKSYKKKIKHSKVLYEKSDFIDSLILPAISPLKKDSTSISNFIWLRMYKTCIVSDECFVSEREVYTEDLFFNLVAYRNCNRVSFVDKCLYHYVMNDGSLTHVYRNNKYDMEINRLNRIQAYLDEGNIVADKRLYLVVVKLIWGCIDNAASAKEYRNYKKDISVLFNNKMFKNMPIKLMTYDISFSEWFCYKCYSYNLKFVAFLYKKIVGLIIRIM